MKNSMSFFKENIAIGFLLFALFLGAGNIIFPPLLGQQAGENLLPAIFGFLITGVGLPLIAIIAVAKSGGDLYLLANRVHPMFGLIFTSLVYLTIGPLFALPRTGSVTYEIGVVPFLTIFPASIQESWVPLFIVSLAFFGLVLYLAFNPTKLVDRIGKILTPILFIIISMLFLKSIFTPMGSIGEATGKYVDAPLAEGFIQGYLTIDVLAALVFGIVILQILKDRKILEPNKQIVTTIFAGVVAAIGLGFVYISLTYIGATSVDSVGMAEDGGKILARASDVLFGNFGKVILGLTIALACITTAVGLVSANAQFFSRIFPKLSYNGLLIFFTLMSIAITNVGLKTLISMSLPMLLFLYPIAIVLMLLSFLDSHFNQSSLVYSLALIPTAIVSLYDALKSISGTLADANISIAIFERIVEGYGKVIGILPLYSYSLAWLVPAVIGTVIGFIIYKVSSAK